MGCRVFFGLELRCGMLFLYSGGRFRIWRWFCRVKGCCLIDESGEGNGNNNNESMGDTEGMYMVVLGDMVV